jgi:hypothetical protein
MCQIGLGIIDQNPRAKPGAERGIRTTRRIKGPDRAELAGTRFIS